RQLRCAREPAASTRTRRRAGQRAARAGPVRSRGAAVHTRSTRRSRRSSVSSQDRKSTRLNSSHVEISYAVFCLKKKKKQKNRRTEIKKYQDPNLRKLMIQNQTKHTCNRTAIRYPT